MKTMSRLHLWPVCIFLIFLFPSCLQKPEHQQLQIAISKAGPGNHYANYPSWLKIVDTTLVVHNLYPLETDSALQLLKQCDGLLLSGGPDIFPGQYGKEQDTVKAENIDHRRDTLELLLIDRALAMGMPILGICRGLQILNVSQGGSLIVDIPGDFQGNIIHRCADKNNCYHKISIDTNSLLYITSKTQMGFVNTNHHQGIDKLAENLKATAWADDGLIESVEWKSQPNQFVMAVQWHPERLDPGNPLSLPVALIFIKYAEQFHTLQGKKQTGY